MIKTRYEEYPPYIIEWNRKLDKCSCGSDIILMLNFHKQLPAGLLRCGKGNPKHCTEVSMFECHTKELTLNSLDGLYKNYKRYIMGHDKITET